MQEALKHQIDLGVLLVHGIGQQAEGDTLVRFGEPIQHWLQRWLAGESEPKDLTTATIVEARFNAVNNPERTPAYAYLQIDGKPLQRDFSNRWLLAESWWADAFLSPGFGDIANWGFKILPWSLSTHFATRARRVWKQFGEVSRFRRLGVGLRLAFEILSFLLALMLFPVLVSILMLILIIGALPIPRVRAFAAQLQQMLAGTLGDSYVLIASPIQEAVIIGKVEEDLRWLLKQGCRRIAVVAHSQGAAVAHAALKKVLADEQNLEADFHEDDQTHVLFVSVGSGLNKLSEIRHIRGKSNPRSVWLAPAGFLLSALSLPELISSIRFEEPNVMAAIFAAFGIAFLIPGVMQALVQFRPKPEALKLNSKWGVKWLDFYASADPVPNGPMYDSKEMTQAVMNTRKVHNRASFVSDHTSYWRNEDGFIGHLVGALCDLTGIPHVKEDSLDESHLMVALPRRKWRVGWLFAVRQMIILLTIILIGRNWESLTSLTDMSMGMLTSLIDGIPLIGGLISLVDVGDDVSYLVSVSIVVTISLTVYFVLLAAWSVWSRTELVALYERRGYETFSSTFIVFLFLFFIAIAGYVLSIFGMGNGIPPGLAAPIGIWLMLCVTLGLIFGLLYLSLALVWYAVSTAWRTAQKIGRLITNKEVANRPSALGQIERNESARLIDWREDKAYPRRAWISFMALIALTFPFVAVIASSMTSQELWGESRFWEYIIEKPEELADAIEKQSRESFIALWQWLAGSLVLVVCWNIVGILGGFKKVYGWFKRISVAEPIAISHARKLPPQQAKEILLQGTSALAQEMESLEAEIRAMDGNELPEKQRRRDRKHAAAQLRARAHDALAIIQLLPVDEPKVNKLLLDLGRLMPAAAMAWGRRTGAEDPETALRLLASHSGQLSRRERKALENYKQLKQKNATS